ncbi:MAG: ABC transporter permease, partial [Eubacteriales bacterium]|nr:ABC transporter permease [Eubacteriales bacterium]
SFSHKIPVLGTKLGIVSEVILGYGFLVYAAIIIAILLHHLLNKTRVGLNLRAVGENPGTADAAGINVTKYKYLAT